MTRARRLSGTWSPERQPIRQGAGARKESLAYGFTNMGSYDELMRNGEAAAKALGLDLIRIEMPAPQDFASATAVVLRERADALLISPNSTNFIVRNGA